METTITGALHCQIIIATVIGIVRAILNVVTTMGKDNAPILIIPPEVMAHILEVVG